MEIYSDKSLIARAADTNSPYIQLKKDGFVFIRLNRRSGGKRKLLYTFLGRLIIYLVRVPGIPNIDFRRFARKRFCDNCSVAFRDTDAFRLVSFVKKSNTRFQRKYTFDGKLKFGRLVFEKIYYSCSGFKNHLIVRRKTMKTVDFFTQNFLMYRVIKRF